MKTPKEIAEKLSKAVTDSRPNQHLARVEGQNIKDYSISISFLSPSPLERTSLDKVPVLRHGANKLPSVGDIVLISYVGGDYQPFVMGVWAEGTEAGIQSGRERALGDVIMVENGKVKIENSTANLSSILEDIYNRLLSLGIAPAVNGSTPAPHFSGEVPLQVQKMKGLLG